jgi:hypothetical protein
MKSAGGSKRERTRYSRYAKAAFCQDRRLNIRLPSKDLEAIRKRGSRRLAVSGRDLQSAAQIRIRRFKEI